MKYPWLLTRLLVAANALAEETVETVDTLEQCSGAWSVEGEQHTTIEPVAEACEGQQALRVTIRRAVKGWSNIQLKLRCPANAIALRFHAKAVGQDLTIHPQFRASVDWQNWALWLDQPMHLSTSSWRECEIRLDRCHNLFSKGEISKDIQPKGSGSTPS